MASFDNLDGYLFPVYDGLFDQISPQIDGLDPQKISDLYSLELALRMDQITVDDGLWTDIIVNFQSYERGQ